MEIRQIRYFLSAARLGSLKAAAREHFVTQPAVSLQLKKLETELGVTLYTRRGRGIVPTEAGALLLSHGGEIIRRIEDLERSIAGHAGGARGTLAIGMIDAASIYVLPGALRGFRRRYPGVDVRVEVSDSDALLTSLDTGRVELAIVTLPITGANLEIVPFYRDALVLVASPRHTLAASRLARRRPLQAVADRGLITYPARSVTRRLIEKVFIENGFTLRANMEMSSPEAIKQLTEAGLGASILPRKSVVSEVKDGRLVVIPTGRARFERVLGVVHVRTKNLSPPGTIFLKMLLSRYRAQIRTIAG